MKNLILSAIQNDYIKHSKSESDFVHTLKAALRRAQELDLPSALVVVDKNTKKRIQIKKNNQGKFQATILED